MPPDVAYEVMYFLFHWTAMYLVITGIGQLLMTPLAIVVHEFGHLVIAKFEKIPVLKYEIGSGHALLTFHRFGMDWAFNANLLTGGAVHIPRLVPTTAKHWRSIVRASLAGPIANGVATGIFVISSIFTTNFFVQAVLLSLAYANWMCLRQATNDYLMAQTAREKNREKMDGFYVADACEHVMV